MNETLEYLKAFAQFPFALRRFRRCMLTLDEAKRIVRERMDNRERRFLDLMERRIFGHPPSPYRALLEMAGCELGDVQVMLKRRGLEGTLRALREAGVYVTFEEFKGRKPIVRHGHEIPVTTWDFDNPITRRHFSYQTGGSTGAASSVCADVDYVAEQVPHDLILEAADGTLDAPLALWRGILPDNVLAGMLRRACTTRKQAERWFSPIGWRDSKHWFKYAAATCYTLFWMGLYGMQVPFPEVVKVDQALVVARWMAEMVKEHGTCMLSTTVSRAVRACLAAQEAGLDLTGATIRVGGEPPSPAKLRQMERVGARHNPIYVMMECGIIASGCRHPVDGTDVHLLKDAFALFTYPHTVEKIGITVPAFNLTTLLPTAPKLMLNVQMDDYGIVEERHCGCELEDYGFTPRTCARFGAIASLPGRGRL